jgi:RNA polymerase sigma-70 factor (ECF subfamily)
MGRGDDMFAAQEDGSELWAAAKAGLPWAWHQLYAELSPAVAGYLRMQGAGDVDDLVSEVFLGVFRNIGSFAGDGTEFRSWVFVIAHRRLIDERRRQTRVAIDAVADVTEHVRSVGDDTADIAGSRIAAENVVDLCHRLAPDQRDVLLLRIVADLTIEQVAHTLGKSEGAVKALQRRGLMAVQKLFSEQGVPL